MAMLLAETEVIPWQDIEQVARIVALRHAPNDPAIAIDDLIQETMIVMWHKCPNVAGWTLGRGLVWIIAKESQIQAMRRLNSITRQGELPKYDKRITYLDEKIDKPDEFSLEEFVQQRQSLIRVLGETLTAKQAKVIWRQLQGFTDDEIAEALHLSRSAVHKTSRRGYLAIQSADYDERQICDKCGNPMAIKRGIARCPKCHIR